MSSCNDKKPQGTPESIPDQVPCPHGALVRDLIYLYKAMVILDLAQSLKSGGACPSIELLLSNSAGSLWVTISVLRAHFPHILTTLVCISSITPELCLQYLQTHEALLRQLENIAVFDRDTSRHVQISLDDVARWALADGARSSFLADMRRNPAQFLRMFTAAADEIIDRNTTQTADQLPDDIDPLDRRAFDRRQRWREQRLADNGNGEPVDQRYHIPPALIRRYTLSLLPEHDPQSQTRSPIITPLRRVTPTMIGSLVTVHGVVVQATDVQPLMQVAVYVCPCPDCLQETYQEVRAREYIPARKCMSPVCQAKPANAQRNLLPDSAGSVYTSVQIIYLQEMAHEVPVGQVPRSIAVELTGPLVHTLRPGDTARISGIYEPLAHAGPMAFRLGHSADTVLRAQCVVNEKASTQQTSTASDAESEALADVAAARAMLTPEEAARVELLLQRAQDQPRLAYEELARSVAPEIYGYADVKRALALLLVGAPSRRMTDGMSVRGDLNVLLMGDPGVAKSQMLRYCARVAPRAVATTGRGASGVGLTAAVVRDVATGEFTLEAGALVLADRGLCLIDEFDKLTDADQTAVHETMEQQTVSISKAGINTTLNARASVLAAANPAYGRYNARRSVADNINLPPALLSRFDLLFVLLDREDQETDVRLSRHVLFMHLHHCPPPQSLEEEDTNVEPPLTGPQVRLLISLCRLRRPWVPSALIDSIAGRYVQIRQQDRETAERRGGLAGDTFTTPRALLSIIRLSQALARLACREAVQDSDVDEAVRLMISARQHIRDIENAARRRSARTTTAMRNATAQLKTAEEHEGAYVDHAGRLVQPHREVTVRARPRDIPSHEQAWAVVHQMLAEAPQRTATRHDILNRLVMNGLRAADLDSALERYKDIGLVDVSADEQTISLLY